nr:hypothetical protein [Pyrinomonadaceae bacterium]
MRPPLDLSVEITDATSRRYLWGGYLPHYGDRPSGLTFKTRRGDGFADAGMTLKRQIDRDHPDIGLLNNVVIFGHDGDTAYEGRVSSAPRSVGSGGHAIDVSVAGWMAETRRRKAREIYVDRDLGKWRGSSAQRQFNLASTYVVADSTVVPDQTGLLASLKLAMRGPWPTGRSPLCETWYDAGPSSRIGSVHYRYDNGSNVLTSDSNWLLSLRSSNQDDGLNQTDVTGDLAWGGSNNNYIAVASQRFVWWLFLYGPTPGGAELDYTMFIRNVAVYGDHGLPVQPPAPGGLLASDIIRHLLATYCPKLNTGGVV